MVFYIHPWWAGFCNLPQISQNFRFCLHCGGLCCEIIGYLFTTYFVTETPVVCCRSQFLPVSCCFIDTFHSAAQWETIPGTSKSSKLPILRFSHLYSITYLQRSKIRLFWRFPWSHFKYLTSLKTQTKSFIQPSMGPKVQNWKPSNERKA